MKKDYDRTQLLKTALNHTTITIDELANRLGVTPILLYHNLESDEEGDTTVSNLASILGVPVGYFAGEFYYNERGQLVASDK